MRTAAFLLLIACIPAPASLFGAECDAEHPCGDDYLSTLSVCVSQDAKPPTTEEPYRVSTPSGASIEVPYRLDAQLCPEGKMVIALALSLRLTVLAQSGPPSPGAQAAMAEATALSRAEMWSEALRALDKAVTESPQWPSPYFARARVRERLVLTSALDAAGRAYVEGFDYLTGRQQLETIISDYERFLKLAAPDAPERDVAQASLAQRKATLDGVTRVQEAHQAAVAQASRAAEEARARELERQRAEAEARTRAEREAKLAVEAHAREEARAALEASWQADVSSVRKLRGTGIAAAVLAVAAIAASIGSLVAANGQLGSIRAGTLPTGMSIDAAAAAAGTLRTLSLVAALSAVVLGGVGAALFLLPKDPQKPDGLSLAVDAHGAALCFTGVWP